MIRLAMQGHIRLANWFGQCAKAWLDIASRTTKTALIVIADEAKKMAPAGRGQLKRSIQWQLLTADSGLVGSPEKYAMATEAGSGLHGPKKQKYSILPRNRKVLAVVKVIGQGAKFKALKAAGYPIHRFKDGMEAAILGRRVEHPGIQGTHWMERGIEAARPRVLKLTGKDVIGGLVGLY